MPSTDGEYSGFWELANGVPIQAYLAWAFDRLGTHRDVYGLSLEEMTPAAFKATLA